MTLGMKIAIRGTGTFCDNIPIAGRKRTGISSKKTVVCLGWKFDSHTFLTRFKSCIDSNLTHGNVRIKMWHKASVLSPIYTYINGKDEALETQKI
jgi:hypothetical protein